MAPVRFTALNIKTENSRYWVNGNYQTLEVSVLRSMTTFEYWAELKTRERTRLNNIHASPTKVGTWCKSHFDADMVRIMHPHYTNPEGRNERHYSYSIRNLYLSLSTPSFPGFIYDNMGVKKWLHYLSHLTTSIVQWSAAMSPTLFLYSELFKPLNH